MNYFVAVCVSYLFIFLRAGQQINVIRGYYRRIPLYSFAIAFCEVTAVHLIVQDTVWIAIPLGAGGCLGAWHAMKMNKVVRGDRTI
ncbi:hypothetical protein TK45_10730 [Bowmanella sp. JS7-9]|nr:hypothetical protein TK45_10730 [Bowmanella sp. JS7-9]